MGSFGGHTAIDPETGADVITTKEQNAVKVNMHTSKDYILR